MSTAGDEQNVRTLLITVSGEDKPGVTRDLFNTFARFPVHVLDMEQLVVRGRLVLAVLVGVDPRSPLDEGEVITTLRTEIRLTASDLGMDVTTIPGVAEDTAGRHNRIHVTVIGNPLSPSVISKVAEEIAVHGGNIDRIRRIASYPVTAVVLEGSGVNPDTLRRPLAALSTTESADISVQDAGLDRRGQYLVVMDVDSTLIQNEVIDLLADEAGRLAEVAAITDRAMRGEMDFAESLRARVTLLAGLPESVIETVRSRIELTPGARTFVRTLHRLGYRIALVSGGFSQVISPLAAELGVAEMRANTLEIVGGKLTGRVVGPIIDSAGKAAALEEFSVRHGIPRHRTIAIGDGANDIEMIEAAGLGVAFNAKPALKIAADTSVNVPYLDSVLYLFGITREEIESADARDRSNADQ
jgi:phosphoserine phosphatase